MTDDKLLPCPFCGNADDIEMQQAQADHYVQCLECEASTSCVGSRREASELWNRRANVEARDAEITTQRQAADHWFAEANKEHNRAERLEAALRTWWEGKRPFGWDAAKHCANPAVNCNVDTEVLLAYLAAEEARAALDQEVGRG